MKNVAIFASGSGSNAENIIKELRNSSVAQVSVVITNNPKAGVIERAQSLNVPVEIISRTGSDIDQILQLLTKYQTDIILLLGYLRLLPSRVIDEYDGHILNLHPALLPKYGGKGMYGRLVHEAVAGSNDTETGLTLHRVNNQYDDGEVLFQQSVKLPGYRKAEDVESLERELEKSYVAKAVYNLIKTSQI